MNDTYTAQGTDIYDLDPILAYYIVFPGIFFILIFVIYMLRQQYLHNQSLLSKRAVEPMNEKENQPRFSVILPLPSNYIHNSDAKNDSDSDSESVTNKKVRKKSRQKLSTKPNNEDPEYGITSTEFNAYNDSNYDILNAPISSRIHTKSTTIIIHNPTTSTATMDTFLSPHSTSPSRKILSE